ncbi:cell division topological specificity factor MinE [bacterium]|nr:cell division topological specificity factor MinE [bacterium]MBR1776645.1 cell division topological specificity factor MinE [bacterium]
MGLFSSLYNKVAKFFRPQEDDGEASKSVATNRLKLVLMQDRTNLTPRILEQMRSELIDLLSRYVELDKELLELNFEQEGDQVALMLSIPVIRAKDEEEIEAALKAREEQNSKSEGNNEETESDGDSESNEDSDEIIDERTEEEKAEAEKADAIAKELQDVPTIIKKKKVSQPEEMGNNPFKGDDNSEKVELESTTEA